ncbi:MAG: DNA repair protein RecN [Alphaproteobacteria bacterium]|nr:DNA repair protein RecN [Alphaproteobacteria bacterium]
MLSQLSIRNLLLFTSQEVEFGTGLNTLTGETGAGKSMLLDALGLVLGERSDAALIRAGEDQASVTATFHVEENRLLKSVLDELGLNVEDELIIRRTISKDGKSKAFVNDEAVSVTGLKRIGELLVARHGQHDQRGLLEVKEHRKALDAFGGYEKLLTQLATHYHAWKAAEAALANVEAEIEKALREEEYLRHTVQELSALNPVEGEEAELADARQQAQQAKKLRESFDQLREMLEGGQPIVGRLVQAEKLAGRLGLEALTTTLANASREVDEALVQLDKLSGGDVDESALEAKEDRLFALRDAARKYHCQVDGLEAVLKTAQQQLTTLNNQQAERAAAAKRLKETRAAYDAAAAEIFDKRAAAGEKLCKAVEKELKALMMAATSIKVSQTELPEAQWGEAGKHTVQFDVSTNKGQAFGALNKVASGGELSRLLLAMKVVLRETQEASSAIFDEIDAGTGGAVAEAIGQRLKELSANQQVMVVTHLPQVAAQANHHLHIEKQTKAGSTVTKVKTLSRSDRAEELARMLSGATISDEARKAAKKLLQAS